MKRPAYSPDAPRKRSTPLSSPGFQGFHTDQLVHPLHRAGHRRNELLFPHVCPMAPVEGQTTKKGSHVTLEVTSSIWKNIIGSPYPEPDARSSESHMDHLFHPKEVSSDATFQQPTSSIPDNTGALPTAASAAPPTLLAHSHCSYSFLMAVPA